ncbi:hypothetical protein LCGC14_1527970 [marine sediment metagenome]|uniref:Macro domain-containing protein n=1 Tax=marine sediment metagenome TaxID=412755 RepID=A0A0F9JHM3_9ZZZZ
MLISAQTVDITTLEVDTIVNAANNALALGGGVDGAIHKAAGPCLIEYSNLHYPHGCPTGMVRDAPGYDLPARRIFHTVGPDMREYDEWCGNDLLESCYRECMRRAIAERVPSIAFPAISTGAYGFNKENAASIAVSMIYSFQKEIELQNMEVIFACFSDEDTAIIQAELDVWETNND